VSRSSVVIVSYRPTASLDEAITSVVGQADEVLLVDNGSDGGAVSAAARRHGLPVVRLARNAGFAGGADTGVKAASGDVVALLNDDAIAPPGWIESAAATLASDQTVAAVGPKIVLEGRFAELRLDDEPWFAPGDPRPLGRRLNSVTRAGQDVLASLIGGVHQVERLGDERWRWTSGRELIYLRVDDGDDSAIVVNGDEMRPARTVNLINAAGSYLREDGYTGDCGDSTADDGQWDRRRECFALTGAAFVTRADVVRRVGGFARLFFNYYEDTDWCWRARLAGLRHIYDPSKTVVHVRGQTSGGTTDRRVHYLAERNRLLCLLRNAPLDLARRESWRKRTGGGDDHVAEELWRWVPVGLAGRVANRRRWALSPDVVFERWAGVDSPCAVRSKG
jgi:GT2 family glycosyltransferase